MLIGFFKSLVCVLLAMSVPGMTQAQPLRLALNWKAEPEFGGFYEAALQGFYKKQGLDVQIIEGGSGTPTVQMLANEKVDFAIVSADELIIAAERNPKNKMKALFAVYQTSPYVIITHADRGFKSLRDVYQGSGLLSVQSGLPYHQFLLKKFGGARVKVVPYSGGVGSFLADPQFSQQGFITIEPLVAENAGAKVKSFLIADEGFNPYLVVLAVHERTMKARPELVKAFVVATHQGWSAYLKDPTATNKHMASLNKSLSLATFNRGAEVQKPLIQPAGVALGSMTEARWQELIQQMKAIKLIKGDVKAQELFSN